MTQARPFHFRQALERLNPVQEAIRGEQHAAATQLLEEVFDHLLRLPAVPVTVELARKVRDHLDNGGQKILHDRQVHAHADAYTPVGIPLLKLDLNLDSRHVVVSVPEVSGRAWAVQQEAALLRLPRVRALRLELKFGERPSEAG